MYSKIKWVTFTAHPEDLVSHFELSRRKNTSPSKGGGGGVCRMARTRCPCLHSRKSRHCFANNYYTRCSFLIKLKVACVIYQHCVNFIPTKWVYLPRHQVRSQQQSQQRPCQQSARNNITGSFWASVSNAIKEQINIILKKWEPEGKCSMPIT